jgi:hypothetical protein
MMLRDAEKIEVLEEVLQEMDEIAHKLRQLDDSRIRAYCLADFEGRGGGWLGTFVRDVLEERLRELRDPEKPEPEEDDQE